MEVQILQCGAAVVGHKGQKWLLDAPSGVGEELKSLGIAPDHILLTRIASPGIADLEGVKTTCQLPLRGDGLEAEAVQCTHGWDYAVSADDGSVLLYTQRGDVSAHDVEPFDFAVVGNKFRANAFDEDVITRPWPSELVNIVPKVYRSMEAVNPAIKGIDPPVSLAQANLIARWADAMEDADDGPDNPWAAAIAQFKRLYRVADGRWVRKERGSTTGSTTASHAASRAVAGGLAGAVKAEEGERKTEDGKEYPASDYLVVEDRTRPTTWHLRVTKTPGGPPDRSQMGAAAAALTAPGGHRGNRYQGPGREAAISKLRGLYRKLDVPEESWPAGLRSHKHVQALHLLLKHLMPEMETPPDEGGLAVYKKGDQWRWATITSAAIWDKQNELLSRKAMDFAIAYGNLTGNRGPLRHQHIPGLDVGKCDWQMRTGDLLFEAGHFFDTPFAQHCRKVYQSDPAWKVSAGLRYRSDDLIAGIYERAIVFERSATKTPAVPITSIGVRQVEVNDAMLKQVAEELEWPLEEVRELYDRATKAVNETGFESLESLKAALTEQQSEQAVDKLIGSLDEATKDILKRKLAPDAPKEKEKDTGASEDPFAEMKALIAQQGQMIGEGLKAMAEALSTEKEKSVTEAVEDFLSRVPRSEAAHFAVEKAAKPAKGEQATLEAIQAQLNDMAEKMANPLNLLGGTNKAVYDAFTSRKLNPGA